MHTRGMRCVCLEDWTWPCYRDDRYPPYGAVSFYSSIYVAGLRLGITAEAKVTIIKLKVVV